jgi:uncharacterized protein
VSATITPRLVDVVDVSSRLRHHSSGATVRLDDCNVEHWGLSLRCTTLDDPLHDEEVTWLLPGYGLRLTRYRQRRRHSRGGPTLITAVWIEADPRTWTITDLLLGLEVPDYGAARVRHSAEFGDAVSSGLIRCSAADYALRTVHRVLGEIGMHHDLGEWLSYLGISDAW